MTPERMNEILAEYFNVDVRLISFKQDSWADSGNEKGNLSPRDRLLMVFRGRLNRLKSESTIYVDVKNFIKELENLPVDAELYFWECKVENKLRSGWASKNSVIFTLDKTHYDPTLQQ